MKDNRFSNDNLAIIEEDDDYDKESITEPVKKMTKTDKVYKILN